MINVLPQNEKSVLRKEYIIRLATLCIFLFTIIILAASFLLVPAYVLSKNKISAYEIELQKYNESNSNNSANNLSSIVSDINQNLEILNKNKQTKVLTEDIFGVVLSAKPKGVKIKNMSYAVTPENINTIQINGQAADRASLRAFEDSLKNDIRVESTKLPVSSFTKRTDIDFSLSVNLK
jgi:hypothetical protein